MRALKDAALAAVAAALLALPMLGFRLADSENGLTLETRWSWVAIAVAAVFAGRLPPKLVKPSQRRPLIIGLVLAAAALLLPLTPFGDRNILDKATLVLIYVMLG